MSANCTLLDTAAVMAEEGAWMYSELRTSLHNTLQALGVKDLNLRMLPPCAIDELFYPTVHTGSALPHHFSKRFGGGDTIGVVDDKRPSSLPRRYYTYVGAVQNWHLVVYFVTVGMVCLGLIGLATFLVMVACKRCVEDNESAEGDD